MKSVLFVSLSIIAAAKCGIIERGFHTMGDAAHIAHEGIGDMISTGKDLIFGKGIRAGPDPADQGLIPGMIHRAGDGLHLFGDGITHIFSGHDGIHEPLSMMKSKLAAEAAVAPGVSRMAAVTPVEAASAPVEAAATPVAAAAPVAEEAAAHVPLPSS